MKHRVFTRGLQSFSSLRVRRDPWSGPERKRTIGPVVCSKQTYHRLNQSH